MANAYATIADGGVRNTATAIEKVELPDGTVDRFDDKRKREFTDGQTYEVTTALKGVLDHGTAAGLGIGCPAAGKTGTTSSLHRRLVRRLHAEGCRRRCGSATRRRRRR